VRPEVPRTLQLLAQHLLAQVAPRLTEDYAQKTTGVVAGLLLAASEEFDRAAARRVEENRALRLLFADAASVVRSAGLRSRLVAASRGDDDDLRIAPLERANGELRMLLIDLQTHVETLQSEEALRVDERIWEELRAGVARRAIAFWPL
jgi:hypothetical protein